MKLGLFFSKCISLEIWYKKGLATREFKIYNELYSNGELSELHLFTYGSGDQEYLNKLMSEGVIGDYVNLHEMPKIFDNKLGKRIYQLILPFNNKIIKDIDILKTNQLDGSLAALLSKLLYRKKLYVRTGYSLITFMKNQKRYPWVYFWELIERIALKYCDIASAASIADLDEWKNKGVDDKKLKWLPNFIDEKDFKPQSNINERKDRIVFIGRLNEQKNLENILIACERTNVEIDVYGEGELGEELKTRFSDTRIIRFKGKVDNSKVPEILSKYKYYILCSLYEGTPKTLLEAMFCEVYTITSNRPGINLISKFGGTICDGVEHIEIEKGIIDAKKISNEDYSELVSKTRNEVANIYSLRNVTKVEQKIYQLLSDI
ncbi:GalNAc-alpha-(1-_4)-GalNAc-alpha-(1-_3)-diNAcBac-PP-undecaprenol alpha-1,4-N-acetyl-D-galactosaminyltransferase [Vibrio thalassae]|uniref:GalNAc-alpha-(1->4)-GalNAc-alpha-(1->3)-diNAcBac-PP-undecaprenol alpha-1,4-N-acetyl-D-galactosaminyltransferase n=1 Tax=Vibrio thalassae TaxID=1243014 RepID=A0A240EGR1_9VIBR|nr:glycosyltransferase [Vibrio thalassae]SNX47852.1 GalNAc-alpha-(1->4)-GalNAc-alpha-(1->3)-diNAcBac-PP-undecaprenol alpha-1,4-N-acetyl-D-galactosaminyltransferase [Vibrio thalassae]